MEARESHIQNITEAVQASFGGLTPEQLTWKPDRDSWSIAQNLEHLIKINASYFPVIKALQTGSYRKPFLGRFPFLAKLTGQALLNAVEPSRKKRRKTFQIWEPAEAPSSQDILATFLLHQQEFLRMVAEAKPFAEQGVIISSPAHSSIVYPLTTALDMLVTHEERHLRQAQEVWMLYQKSFATT